MTLSNREIWMFMEGAHTQSGQGDEGVIQIYVKYLMICSKLSMTPLSAEEIAKLRVETITTIGGAAQEMQALDIWSKKPVG